MRQDWNIFWRWERRLKKRSVLLHTWNNCDINIFFGTSRYKQYKDYCYHINISHILVVHFRHMTPYCQKCEKIPPTDTGRRSSIYNVRLTYRISLLNSARGLSVDFLIQANKKSVCIWEYWRNTILLSLTWFLDG